MIKLKKIAVVGAGTMGAGIAQWFAQNQIQVTLADLSEDALSSAKNKIHKSWEKLLAKKKFKQSEIDTFSSQLSTSTVDNLNGDYDLIVEAIFEDLEIKQQLFAQLDKSLNKECLFASNTSSFSINKLCSNLPESRKENFLGLHFFNPATIMKLVEIIPSAQIKKQTIDDLYQWFEQQGKMPAKCGDAPGFIVNRVARNFYGESLRIVKNDDKEKYLKTDEILKEVGGFKMGPFELMDLIGIDINYQVTCSVWNSFYQEPRFAPHALQRQMVESGRLGKKTKKGFYQYE